MATIDRTMRAALLALIRTGRCDLVTPVVLDLSCQDGNRRRGVVTYRTHHHQAPGSPCYGLLEYAFDVHGAPTVENQMHNLECVGAYKEYQRCQAALRRRTQVSIPPARSQHAASFGAMIGRRSTSVQH